MKTLLYFNAPDAPVGVEQSQLVDSVQQFVDERRSSFPDLLIQGNELRMLHLQIFN
jgi:hypothetical protein